MRELPPSDHARGRGRALVALEQHALVWEVRPGLPERRHVPLAGAVGEVVRDLDTHGERVIG